jgi:hypothetical protein
LVLGCISDEFKANLLYAFSEDPGRNQRGEKEQRQGEEKRRRERDRYIVVGRLHRHTYKTDGRRLIRRRIGRHVRRKRSLGWLCLF